MTDINEELRTFSRGFAYAPPSTVTISLNYDWLCREILHRNNKFMEETTINDAIEILRQMEKEQEKGV